MVPAFGLFVGVLLTTSNTTPASEMTSSCLLEVCVSPGCVADGSKVTLDRMMALAPSTRVQVVKGGCVALCGKGPVVRENESIRHKYIKEGDKLLEKILGESLPSELVDGYDLVQRAKQTATKKKDYAHAVQLYSQGIAKALDTATKNADKHASGPEAQTPLNLLWLVEAYRDLAEILLETNDIKGAYTAVNSACKLSNGSDPLCFELLSKVYQAKSDNEGELKALQSMFDIPIEEETLPWHVSNRRRELEFRLIRLKNTVE